ncbi:MAG: TQO small subunit DoxD [Planctomycetota bacterium]|nr:TQO small subunit DoxD [Planctomycetota bacterium]
MFQLNKFQIVVSFLFLAALRITIGFHFFDQGHQKYRQGGFDSTGFLKAAKGPFAPLFQNMIPDADGRIRLCYDPLKEGSNKIDARKTLEIWEQYKNYIVDELIKEEARLVRRREQTRIRLESMDPASEPYLIANSRYKRDEQTILAIRAARAGGDANRIFRKYSEQLEYFLSANEEEINYYFLGEDRLDGFQRDFVSTNTDSTSDSGKDEVRDSRMKQAAKKVNLLRDQVETIKYDRISAAAGWLATIDSYWEGFEYELLHLANLSDGQKVALKLDKPSESESIQLINRIIPYFDMAVGLLLILGLFARTAALAAGGFLLSILMTQPAILGEASAPTTILYAIEMFAAFVLFATCAGRYAGLDYFIHAGLRRILKPETEELA